MKYIKCPSCGRNMKKPKKNEPTICNICVSGTQRIEQDNLVLLFAD